MPDSDISTPETSTRPAITRRSFLKAGGAVAAAVGATALGAAPALGETTRRYRSAAKQTQITLMTFELFEAQEIAAWRKVIGAFSAKTGIKVNWTGWPFSTFDTNVIAQAQSGRLDADVIQCTPEVASSLIVNYNLALPLEKVSEAVGLIPNPASRQFYLHGHQYALGFLEVAFVNAYDEAVLKSAGVSGPPTTLDEWLSISEKVAKPPNRFANFLINNVTGNGSDMWNQLQNWPLGFGGVWANGTDLTIDSPQNIGAIEYWLHLLQASGVAGSSEVALQKLWFDAQIGMSFQVAAGSASLKVIAPKLLPNLRSAPPPWPGKKAISRVHPLVVPKTSKNVDAAMELVKWIIEPKNIYYVTVQNGYPLIPYTNLADFVPAYTKYEASLPWGAGFRETNFVGEFDLLGKYTYGYAQIGDIVCTNVERAVSGSATVKEALQAAQAQAKESIHL